MTSIVTIVFLAPEDPAQLATAELRFSGGALHGLSIAGFGVWWRSPPDGTYRVSMPANITSDYTALEAVMASAYLQVRDDRYDLPRLARLRGPLNDDIPGLEDVLVTRIS